MKPKVLRQFFSGATFLVLTCLLFGCSGRQTTGKQAPPVPVKLSPPTAQAKGPTPPQPASPAPRSAASDTIRIASFNIQVFGTSKIQKPAVMDVLTKTVRKFDLVAIQEVRSTDDSILPTFIQMINAAGGHYDFVIGPRLGRTSSKEQYVYVFDTTRIEIDSSSVYTVPDPEDRLHREPLVARFRVRGNDPQRAFTFRLVNIHTDPDETKTELDALANVFTSVQQREPFEDDVILLGDLNVDENHLGKLGQIPGINFAIAGVPTNTRRNKTYDNIIFQRSATTEYTGRSGVFNLMSEFNLSESQALEVSDHMPIWAEFSVYESGATTAQAPALSQLGR